MSVRRATDSVYLQYIWNAIEACPKNAAESHFQTILNYIRSEYDPKCVPQKLESELSNSIRDECVKLDQSQYRVVDILTSFKKDRSDWYCFECHGPGRVVQCPTCFRVYHPDCLSAACETQWTSRLPREDPTVGTDATCEPGLPPTHPCPVCKRLSRVANINSTTPSELHRIFCTALDWIRNKVRWKRMQKVGYLYEPLRNEFFAYYQINTRMIGDKMRADPTSKEGYPNRTSLLVDLDNLVHSAAVFYGTKDDMSNMARQIRSQLRREMRESAYCIDCYLRHPGTSTSARLAAPCRAPHRLLWFHHNGWSFRPCKILYESSEGYEVVCFGGRHEREFVPRARAVDSTFTASELGLRMTPSLKKALDEAEEYKANQGAYDRNQSLSHSGEYPPSFPSFRLSSGAGANQEPAGTAFGYPLKSPPSSSGDSIVPVVHRKRKAGQKYTSAFGSTDLEIPASSGTKRRKSATGPSTKKSTTDGQSTKEPRLTTKLKRSGGSLDVSSNGGDSLSSSLNSDTDLSDGFDSLKLDHQHSAKHSKVFGCFSTNEIGTMPPKVDPAIHQPASEQMNGFMKSGTLLSPVTRASPTIPATIRHPSSPSNTALSSGTTDSHPSQRIIRIKPLPLRPKLDDDSDASKSGHRLNSCNPVGHCDTRLKIEQCTSSSSSSAQSCHSSGRTTIPAVASLDSHTSSDSLVSSASSLSSVKINDRKGKVGRPPKRAKQRAIRSTLPSSELHTESVISKQKSHSSASKSKSQRRANTATLSSTHTQANPPAVDKRPVAFARSPSPLSSLSDSDSTVSSLLSYSRTPSPSSSDPSSSSSSSSTVSSSSTIPSPTRRLSSSIAKNGSKRDPAFVYDHHLDTVASDRSKSKSVEHTSPPDLIKPLVTGAPTYPATGTEDRSPSPVKPTKMDYHNPHRGPLPHQTLLFEDHIVSAPVSSRNMDSNPDEIYSDGESSPPTVGKTAKKKSKVVIGSHPNAPLRRSLTTSAGSLGTQSHGLAASTKSGPCNTTLNSTWSSGARLPGVYGSHTPVSHLPLNPGTGLTSTGPTPPSSSSSSASSCYSSVSPAALSTTSGLGSSLSDPKSVDASPGEVAALLGNTSFSCPNGNAGSGVGAQADPTLLKAAEERIHRIYADRLISLTTERDQAREEINRRDAMISKMRREHEAEIKRVKQKTWCQVCLKEAFYHCCPGTAYCSEDCQLQHWTTQHNRECQRRAEAQQRLEQQQMQR
ncbi:unnamed protein product [Calicophoron daubneyi]|uniref:MYND-type domain-containing protein n=1 Tax=Calicophoron daubneyi TaxID=300641 RepID=A0AAV2TT52_CALDB